MLCFTATVKAGPEAPGKCTAHNIDGPGAMETLEATFGKTLDPEVLARIDGFSHRMEGEKVSRVGTHIVPVATYPATRKGAVVDPTYGPVWGLNPYSLHNINLFREEIAIKGVQPNSIKSEKNAFPNLTEYAVKFGPTSMGLLTGDLPQAEKVENAVDMVWGELGRNPYHKLDDQARAFAVEAATLGIARGKSVRDVVAQIGQDIEDGKARGYQAGAIPLANAVAEEMDLPDEQAAAFALEAGKKGAEWLEAALASEEDRKMHEAEYAPTAKPSPSITDPEQTGNLLDADAKAINDELAGFIVGGRREQAKGFDVASLDPSAIVAELIANNEAFRGLKETQRKAASNAVTSKAGDVYDVLGEILGVSQPARMSTPVGDIPLQSDWLHKDDVYALMSTPAYQNDALPQSSAVRDTVKGFFQQAYSGKANLDASKRRIDTPTVNRTQNAPVNVQTKKSLTTLSNPSTPPADDPAKRREEITKGVQAYGMGGALQGLKEAEKRQTDERAAAIEKEAKADEAKRAREAAARAQDAAKAEQDAKLSRQKEAAREEQTRNLPPGNQAIFGQNPFEKADPAEAAKKSATETPLGFSKSTPLGGGKQHGAEGFVPRGSRRTVAPSVGGKGKPALGKNPGGDGGGNYDFSKRDKGDGWGKQHGAEGIIPDNVEKYEKSSLRPVTSWGGIVRSAGGPVVTGQKPGLGEYNGGRHNQTDNISERVVCTELVAQGLLNPGLYFLDVRFTEERLNAAHVRGYHMWAVPLVRL
ncbi:MAG: hypothetical protein HQ513_10845, partial [Rhodospirillales bacterium]|nr:hypothetical protein [Rhodospirillales bacterium]